MNWECDDLVFIVADFKNWNVSFSTVKHIRTDARDASVIRLRQKQRQLLEKRNPMSCYRSQSYSLASGMEYNVLSHDCIHLIRPFSSVESDNRFRTGIINHKSSPSVGRVGRRRASSVAKCYRLTTTDISLRSALCFACNHSQFGLVYELQTHCIVASWILAGW